jgi:hypothetical protein
LIHPGSFIYTAEKNSLQPFSSLHPNPSKLTLTHSDGRVCSTSSFSNST